ncbi:unnamed protein product [Camellia sinensis]
MTAAAIDGSARPVRRQQRLTIRDWFDGSTVQRRDWFFSSIYKKSQNICKETSNGPESQLKGCSSVIHFVLDSITFRKAPNMLYCDISSFQPMEIYVDDEAKLTLHGLVQVIVSPDADPPVVRIMDYNKYRYELQKKKMEQQKKSIGWI